MEQIIVNDDCSIAESDLSVAGKRGLVGVLFVIKIAGAFAESGSPLHEVTEMAQHVLQNIATFGIGLTACAIPGIHVSSVLFSSVANLPRYIFGIKLARAVRLTHRYTCRDGVYAHRYGPVNPV